VRIDFFSFFFLLWGMETFMNFYFFNSLFFAGCVWIFEEGEKK